MVRTPSDDVTDESERVPQDESSGRLAGEFLLIYIKHNSISVELMKLDALLHTVQLAHHEYALAVGTIHAHCLLGHEQLTRAVQTLHKRVLLFNPSPTSSELLSFVIMLASHL